MSQRSNIVFSDPQIAALRIEAARLGISVGELVRRIVDEARKGWGK